MTTRREFVGTMGLTVAAGAAWPARSMARMLSQATFFDWKEVGKGVHATHDGSSGGNVMVVVGEGMALLVDAKFGPMSPVLRREAESHGAPIRHLVNTHHHGDHTSGNVGFSANAEVWANEKARPRIVAQVDRYISDLAGGAGMLTRGEREPEEWMLEEAGKMADRRATFDAEDWAPGRTLTGGENVIEFGRRAIEVRHVGPGHTDNDVFIKVIDANVVHAGDLLFNGLHPYFDPNGGGSSKGWIDSLSGVIAICDAETVVVPGHGAIGDIESLKKARAHHEQLREAVAKAIADGKTKEETTEMSWGFMEGLGREQLRPRAIAFVYDEIKADGQ